MNYREDIERYTSEDRQEMKEKEVIQEYIKQFPDNILTRENEFAHLTSSGFVMNKSLDKVLMIYHKIYDTWAWTGGHADGDEDMLYVALKEAREETGLTHLEPLSDKIASIDILPVWNHIKRGNFVPTHMHLNVTYILIGDENEPLKLNAEETKGVRWLPADELEKYCTEERILPIYHKLIKRAQTLKMA